MDDKKKRIPSRATAFDASKYLKDDAIVQHYLSNALEDGDPRLIQAALGNIAKARGMSELARESGIKRESLYKALSVDGNPEFATIAAVARALGLRINFEPMPVEPGEQAGKKPASGSGSTIKPARKASGTADAPVRSRAISIKNAPEMAERAAAA